MNLLSFNLYQLKYNYLIYNKQVGGGQFKNHPRLFITLYIVCPTQTTFQPDIR